ncbi:DUF3301 domain-containing protein [Atopomonas sediminilitoris]|uniref:DUF3301 domain-containing protein n=1 Tax=Atopomonas sediminilitoris TaxID=2919919 RepID=UPI001F4E3A3D|nr:DUF3301 domain-containing protein [Atopomonas sediminilitoris]MCJ8169467.1 DUF3301 domain-containing protein [Atopomonas sediminilitoris]
MNLSLTHIALLLIGGAAVAWWLRGLSLKQAALSAARRRCQRLDVQLLDQTIALSRIRLKRADNGRWFMQRIYQFEFSADGSDRYQGRVELRGARQGSIEMDAHRLPE